MYHYTNPKPINYCDETTKEITFFVLVAIIVVVVIVTAIQSTKNTDKKDSQKRQPKNIA